MRSLTRVQLLGKAFELTKAGSVVEMQRSLRDQEEGGWIVGVSDAVDDAAVHSEQWERHVHSDEILYLMEGAIRLTLTEDFRSQQQVSLKRGDTVVVSRGTWHRLNVEEPARLLYLTRAYGTERIKVRDEPGEDYATITAVSVL